MPAGRTITTLMLALSVSAAALAQTVSNAKAMARVSGATFESVLPVAPGQTKATVKNFRMDATPVTNSEFAVFLKTRPEWRRDRITRLLADSDYLSHWRDASHPGDEISQRPLTRVSWYAARAYCKARNARLPTWYEWEWAAAASATVADAREDPIWRQQILEWYARPSTTLPKAGSTPANRYGIRDLHGVIWEWVEDFNGMLVSSDSRSQSDPDVTRFCGSGALTMEQKDQYAVLMRIAMLSSLEAKYTTATLGFRCAADEQGETQ